MSKPEKKSIVPATTAAIEPKSSTHDPIKFDRRSSIRLPMTAVAMATIALEDGGTILTGVEIVDTSAAGLGVRSPVKISPGTTFTLYPDKNTWPAKSGIVSRCSWDGEYFRCGLNLSLAMAA